MSSRVADYRGVLLTFIVALAAPVHAVEPTLDLRAGYAYDNNLGNSEVNGLRQADSIFEADATVGFRQQLGGSSGVVAKAGIESDVHAETTGLNAVTAMASLALVVQPDRGFAAPWFAVNGAVRWRRHRDSDIRDGTLASVGLVAGKRFTDRVSAQVGLEVLRRRGDRGRVFDLGQRTVSLLADYRFSNRLTGFAQYRYLDGGLVTVSPRNPKLRPVSRASAPDPAFGPNRLAWRLDGHAHSLRLGSKYLLAEKTGLEGSVTYSSASADNDNEWDSWRASVSLVHRFD